jgi:hypothetical protein
MRTPGGPSATKAFGHRVISSKQIFAIGATLGNFSGGPAGSSVVERQSYTEIRRYRTEADHFDQDVREVVLKEHFLALP